MKRSVLQFLRCPCCRQPLRLAARHADEESVNSGWLVCEECPEAYRIVNGIPRFVRSDQYTLETDRRWNGVSRIYLDSAVGTTEAEDALAACTGWSAADYRGQLVLDVGVGTGRFAEAAARYGCEVVGVDFNATVDCAHNNLARFKNVHLVQAELSALPFAHSTFDLAYSIGVLRHTPDPAEAFRQVANAVKPSGRVAVSLNNDRRLAQRSAARIRYLTTRIPLSLVLSAAALSIPLYYGHRLPVLGTMLQSFCPVVSHTDWRRRWLDTFDWYSATYHWTFNPAEVGSWLRKNGFTDFDISPDLSRVTGRKKPAPLDAEAPQATLAAHG